MVKFDGGRAELLPNGFVRVDCSSGPVRMWERGSDVTWRDASPIARRSGQGIASTSERAVVADLLYR